jgi:hypothetical protein
MYHRLPQELTLLQKHEVANTEGDLAKAQIEECKNVSEKLIDDLRVREGCATRIRKK